MEVDKNGLAMISMSEAIKVELFRDIDLMFNVLKHELVPEHTVLS